MKSVKLKQVLVGILASLSLFVSTISACSCSHHQVKQKTETAASCHEHSTETGRNRVVDSTDESNEKSITGDYCVCLQTVSKVFAKSERVKIEKQTAAAVLTFKQVFESAGVRQSAAEKIDFIKPFYLSDSFYNLSPGRAPPVL